MAVVQASAMGVMVGLHQHPPRLVVGRGLGSEFSNLSGLRAGKGNPRKKGLVVMEQEGPNRRLDKLFNCGGEMIADLYWDHSTDRTLPSRDGTEMFFQGEDKWRISSYGDQLPNQAESVAGATTIQAEFKSLPDLDYLQELLAIQQSGPRAIGFFGTRNMGFMHQQLIEILSYAMVITKNHIYTSGASGTNAAVIRGALRAEMPELLTVILPQSLKKQPPESQDLLSKVKNVIEMPHNDHLPLLEASSDPDSKPKGSHFILEIAAYAMVIDSIVAHRHGEGLCNMDILSHVQQVLCFAFHDSNLLMETCREAKNLRKIVTLFYLD